jgi:hemolysin-activating ACP:hemolysin acyltransferase
LHSFRPHLLRNWHAFLVPMLTKRQHNFFELNRLRPMVLTGWAGPTDMTENRSVI